MGLTDDNVNVKITGSVTGLVAAMEEGAAVVKAGTASMTSSVAAMSGTIAAVTAPLVALLALFGGFSVLTEMVNHIVDTGSELGNLAQKTGVAVDDLSRLQYAAHLSDVSVEGLSGGLTKLARAMEAAASGDEKQAAAFKSIGVSAVDATGKLRPVNDVVSDVAAKFAAMEDGTGKANIAMDLFGKSGQDLIPLLNQGRDGIKAMADESDRLGNTWSQDAVDAAGQFEDATKRLGAVWAGFTRDLVVATLPVLTKLVQLLQSIVHLTVASVQGLRAIGAALTGNFDQMFEIADKAAAALQKAMDAFREQQAGGGGPRTGAPPVTGDAANKKLMDELQAVTDDEIRTRQAAYEKFRQSFADLDAWLEKEAERTQHELEQGWVDTIGAIPRAWQGAVRSLQNTTASWGDFFREMLSGLLAEYAAFEARTIVIHNAAWLEKRKATLLGWAAEAAGAIATTAIVVGQYAIQAAAATWAAISAIPIIGPVLAPAAALAALAGVLALAHGGGGGGSAAPSQQTASAPAKSQSGGDTFNIYAMDSRSFHGYLMENADAVAKATAQGAKNGVLMPGAPGRG